MEERLKVEIRVLKQSDATALGLTNTGAPQTRIAAEVLAREAMAKMWESVGYKSSFFSDVPRDDLEDNKEQWVVIEIN